jgi:glycosyltransferase involved in cell wall biosynthesis
VHITIDYTQALRQGAGIGRYTRGLVDALAELDRVNTYTLFCAGQAPTRVDWPANFRVRVAPLPARWLSIGWHRLHLPVPAELLAGPCDVFHSPDFTLPPLARARGVVTVHDLSFIIVPDCADAKLRAYLNKAVPRSVRRATRVLADSANTSSDLMRLLNVPAEKISVVQAGVEPRFQPIRDPSQLAAVRTRYRLPDHFILSVGTLEPRKNFARLIEAYAALRRETAPGVDVPRLVIAGGPGWLYEDIYAEARRQEVTDSVCFTGFIADADLPALYSLADLFVFPSLYEGFGIPPLEAMACGVPVVCANNSSLPEAVDGAALLVNALDTAALTHAMSQVLVDPTIRARLIERGHAHATRFTWYAAARQLLSAYGAA